MGFNNWEGSVSLNEWMSLGWILKSLKRLKIIFKKIFNFFKFLDLKFVYKNLVKFYKNPKKFSRENRVQWLVSD
jgi:hypothetical protein